MGSIQTLSFSRIQNKKNELLLAERCYLAHSFIARLKGLIGTSELRSGEGLWLQPCNDIHMWFMSIPIDVVFINKHYQVTSIQPNLRPWRIFPVRDWKASITLELPVGTIDRCQVQPGDQLCIS